MRTGNFLNALFVLASLASSPVMGEPRALRHLASHFRTLADRDLLSGDCLDIDGNAVCIYFDAGTWSCLVEWNGVACDACAMCESGDESPVGYSCELAAQAAGATTCPTDMVNVGCTTEGSAQDCFILPYEKDPAPPDETFLDPSNPPPPAAEDGGTFLQIPVASVPPEPSLQTKPPEVQTVAPDVRAASILLMQTRADLPVLPTTPPSQTAAPSVCAVTVANTDETCSQLLKFTTAACDCYNYCNGKLIGCLAFGERSSFSCAGETVAGCTSNQEETAPVTPDKETPTYSPDSPVFVTPLMPICQTKYNSTRTCGTKWSAPEVDGCIACYSNILSGVSTCGDAVGACQDIPMQCECGDCIEEILAWIECESQHSCPGLRCSGNPQPQAAAEEDNDGGKMVVLIVGIVCTVIGFVFLVAGFYLFHRFRSANKDESPKAQTSAGSVEPTHTQDVLVDEEKSRSKEEILERGTPMQVYQKELPVQEAAPQARAPPASAAPARGNHAPMENDLDKAPSDDDSLFEC
ncbi:unknown protein [Seminavis robusta]|uniref:Uncharacterized protein n=1 Tax=Seminavis robusta TaxID=568900 RepID=A0A9N8HZ59_9STRA|nr:unknown protein [Seminavis robusta]|eukprot:Sro2785_g337020.1 n/a (523) ;mRNA; f:6829-8604